MFPPRWLLLLLVLLLIKLVASNQQRQQTSPRPPQITCTISGLPKNVSTYTEAGYPFASSLLHIFDWMRPQCDGRVATVTFGNAATTPNGFFYLGVFQSLHLDVPPNINNDDDEERPTYYQLLDYIAINTSQGESDRVQIYQVPANVTLRITRQNAIGIFYDKWDTAQEQLVIPYRSVTDDTARNFKAYVGFMSMVQLKQITQLRVGGELGIKASGRKPALSVTVGPILVDGSSAPDEAVKMCRGPPTIAHGGIVAAPSSSPLPGTFMPGDFALYTCNAGFSLGSSVYATCNQGTWMPIPVCLGSCGSTIPEIPLAHVVIKSFTTTSRVGDVIHYSCVTSHVLAPGSQSKVICQQSRNGTFVWSEKPVCIPAKAGHELLTTPTPPITDEVSCPSPPDKIEHGSLETKSYAAKAIPGDHASYKCDENFLLIGTEMFCRPDGTWSQAPKCVPQPVSGSIAARSAPQGAQFVGMTATLEPGSVTCGDPPKIANARVSRRSYVNRPSTWLDTVIYECIVGFRMKTMAIVGCSQNGTWVGFPNLPVCEMAPQNKRENVVSGSCGIAPDVPNARIGVFRVRNSTSSSVTASVVTTTTQSSSSAVATPFEFIQYECHPGFRLDTKFSVVTCNQATRNWSEKPRCVRKQVDKNSKSAMIMLDNEEDIPAAAPPIDAGQGIDPKARQAQQAPVLTGGQVTCGEAVEIDNGHILSTTFSGRISIAGDTITYNCYQGFTLVGKKTIKCDRFSQQWEPEPQCVVSCGSPPVVEGGHVVVKNFHDDQSVIGSVAKYACEIGMTLQTSDTITCLRDGQWSSIPTCHFGGAIATACPPPPAIQNGTILSRSYTSNRASWFDTVRYACDQGFHMDMADPTITCKNDGTWSRTPRCYRNPGCKAAPIVTNGYVYASNFSGDSSEVGSYIRYRCRAGYRLMGLDLVFCGGNLLWTTRPTCEIMYCNAPPNVRNGQQFNRTWPESRKPQDGDRVSYLCNPGYRVEAGTSTIVCLYDGTWTPEPNCVPDVPSTPTTCGAPLRLPYGSIQSASFDYNRLGAKSKIGDNVVYLCDSQYILVGPANVRCDENGQWSMLPGCTLGCGIPPVVLNGHVETKNFSETSMPGSFIRYVCNSGYVLNGDGVMTCGDDGLWYGNIPICTAAQAKCESVPTVKNAKEFSRSFSTSFTMAAIGDYVTFICNVGYTMQGRRDVACLNDGSWSILPQCVGDQPKSCGEPPRIANAVVQSVSYSTRASAPGDTAIYQCTNGVVLSSRDLTATCDSSGRWLQVPACSSGCGSAPILVNGYITSSSFIGNQSSSGASIRYDCLDGFSLQGPKIVTCSDDGRWSTMPSCQTSAAFCSGVPKVVNGHETSRTYSSLQALAGDQITFICDAGFVMQGSQVVKCLDSGIWSSPPACAVDWNRAQTCGEAPLSISNGRLDRTTYQGRKSVPGDAAFYSCSRNYAIYGSNVAYCDKTNQWSSLPRCVFTCGPPPTVDEGSIIWQNYTSTLPSTPGSAVRYSCSPGFGIRTSDMIICQPSGQWTSMPLCEAGVVTAQVDATAGVGSQCPPAPSITNGGAVVTSYFGRQPISGDTITYACSGSYQLVGNETVTCLKGGNWGTLPMCVTGGRQCSHPPRISNGVEQSRTYRTIEAKPGDRVQFTCAEGYRMVGGDTITCQPDGHWSGVPQCITVQSIGPKSCGIAPILVNGRIVSQSFPSGQTSSERDTISYACNEGYSMVGYNIATCTSSGTWTSLPICRDNQQTCGVAPALANGRVVRQSFSGRQSQKGDSATYACNDGFTLSPPSASTITCDPVALQWTILPNCLGAQKTCGIAPVLVNGRLLSQSFQRGASSSPGDTLSYDCNSGYALSGNSVVTCDPATSRWTTMPICQQAGCGFAPSFANAAIVSQDFTGSSSCPGSIVRYQCNPGYNLMSGYDSFVKCNSNGKWSNGPICEAACGNPPVLYNGQITARTYQTVPQPGDTVTYCCNNGYTMTGEPKITCQSQGGWSTPPQCCYSQAASQICNEPPAIANGQILTRNYGDDNLPSPGDWITYGCDDGYYLEGQSKSFCENATLSFKPRPCCLLLQTCGNCPQLLNGRILTTSFPAGDQGRPGDTITYTCNNGYTMVSGTSTISCDSTLLWGALPICMIMCPQPPIIPNGKIVSTNYSTENKLLPASTVKYACINDTYVLRGSNTITCTSQGRWTTTPLCLSNTCGDPPTVGHAKIIASTFTGRTSAQSDMATYACDSGYVLQGNSQVYCDRTLSWSPPPSCQLSCGGPPASASANVAWRNFTGTASVPGSMIRYTCVDKMQMQGFAIQICGDNGQWSPSAPSCGPSASCGPPPSLNNGVIASQSFTKGGNPQIGDSITYGCNKGYMLVGSPAVACDPNSLTWETMPECVVTCNAPPKIPNGLIDWMNFTDTASVVGSTAHYICSSGYGIKGPDMVSCLSTGTWSTVPTCQNLTCGAAPQITNGKISGSTFANKTSQPGDMVSYDCNTGFSLSGDETINCDGGTQQWTTPPSCVENPTCGPIPKIDNGAIVRTNLVSGTTQKAGFLDSVSFACNSGYQIQGPAQVVCAGDPLGWSDLPTCKYVEPSCSDPPILQNGYIQQIQFNDNNKPRKGDSMSYGCNPGYIINGSPSITCDGNPLRWSRMPTCIVSCGYPPAIMYGNITYQNFTGDQSITGSAVRYVCVGGTFLTQGSQTVVCTNGKWGLTPKCEVRTCGDPPLIHNGIINSTNFTGTSSPYDRATYSCNSNYRLSGNSTAACDPVTLRWIGVPSCTLKASCGDPPVVINGQILTTSYYPASRSVIGDTATYACDRGYQMVGQSIGTCDPRSLLWINVPTCQFVVSCGPAPISTGARLVWSNMSSSGDSVPGTVIRYQCQTGLSLQGPDTLICGQDGQWSPSCITCSALTTPTCPQPPEITNAHEVSRSFANGNGGQVQVGDYVIYECNQGYSLSGRNKVVCLQTGDWAVQLTCNGPVNQPVRVAAAPARQESCGAAPSIQYARLASSFSPQYSSAGDTLMYQCNKGYAFARGNGEIRCERAGSGSVLRWSTLPQCVISCGPAPIVEGSIIVYTNFTSDQSIPNSVVHYQCQQDYQMRGDDTSYCQANGEWSIAPICEAAVVIFCYSDPPRVDYGYEVMRSFSGRTAKTGDFVSISCDPGYVRYGDDVILCLPTGTWSSTPRCQADRDSPSISNNYLSSVSCGTAPSVPGATISWRQNSATGSRNSQPGDWVEYTCSDPNSDISGPKRVTCQNDGTWSQRPSCVSRLVTRSVSCGDAPVISNAVIIDKTFASNNAIANDRVTYSCSNGFVMSGSAEVRCTLSGWSALPRCLRFGTSGNNLDNPGTCGAAPAVANAVIQQADFMNGNSRPGSRVVYRCVDGYMFSSISISTTTCRNTGFWTAAPQCVAISRNSLATEGCPKAPAVDHASIVYHSFSAADSNHAVSFGSIVIYDCDDGYRITTRNNYVQCTAYGNWTETPICAPIQQCGIPPLIENARVVSRTFNGAVARVTDRVFYACLPGYELATGIYFIQCLNDGNWTNLPQCAKKTVTCGSVQKVPQARMVYKSFQNRASVGDVVWFSCLVGYRMTSGSEVVNCQEDGQWSEAPLCEASTGTCDQPPNVVDADVYYQSFPARTKPIPGDYVRYRCKDGFRIQGDHDEVTCTVAGTWTESPNCIKVVATGEHSGGDTTTVHCGFPPIVKNGRVTMATYDRDKTSPNAGDYVMYTCDTGYVIDSTDSTSTCTVNSTWSGSPKCQKAASTCGNPPSVQQGYIAQPYKTPTLPGTDVTFACANGYRMTGPSKVSCQLSGRWSPTPKCEANQDVASCGGLPVIENAIVLEQNFIGAKSRIGSYATISCNRPYILNGNSRIECLQTNEWSDVPNCVARDTTGISCGPLPFVASAEVSFTTVPEGETGIFGDLIWFQCNNGLQPSTYPGVRCTASGQWSTLPRCIRGEKAVCAPGINMIFVFDLNEVEGFSREFDLPNVASFLDTFPLRWQSLVGEMNSNVTAAHHSLLGLAGVTMTGMAKRDYIWTAMNVSAEARYNSQAWRGWIQKNLAQFKHAFKDDLAKLFRTARNTVLPKLPFTNNNRIVYMTTTRRGGSLMEASIEIDALKAEPWNARVFTLALGPALSAQAQQTVLREEIASDSAYFKFVSSTQDLRVEALVNDKSFSDFLCSSTPSTDLEKK